MRCSGRLEQLGAPLRVESPGLVAAPGKVPLSSTLFFSAEFLKMMEGVQ